MFGLPIETAVIILSVIGFWVVYTAVFVIKTRNWELEDVEDETGAEADR